MLLGRSLPQLLELPQSGLGKVRASEDCSHRHAEKTNNIPGVSI